MVLTDKSCSSLSCIENNVIANSDVHCSDPGKSIVFDLSSWMNGNDSTFWNNFVSAPKQILVGNSIHLDFAYPKELDQNYFSFSIGQYPIVNQSNPRLSNQFTQSGNITVQFQVASKLYPDFSAKLELHVEYRASAEVVQLQPSIFPKGEINSNSSVQVEGSFVGGSVASGQVDVLWDLLGNQSHFEKIPGIKLIIDISPVSTRRHFDVVTTLLTSKNVVSASKQRPGIKLSNDISCKFLALLANVVLSYCYLFSLTSSSPLVTSLLIH